MGTAFRIKLHGHAHLAEPVKHLRDGESAVDRPRVVQPGIEQLKVRFDELRDIHYDTADINCYGRGLGSQRINLTPWGIGGTFDTFDTDGMGVFSIIRGPGASFLPSEA